MEKIVIAKERQQKAREPPVLVLCPNFHITKQLVFL